MQALVLTQTTMCLIFLQSWQTSQNSTSLTEGLFSVFMLWLSSVAYPSKIMYDILMILVDFCENVP